MGDLIAIPAPRRRKRKRPVDAELKIFPFSRRLDLVRDHARAIRGLSRKEQGDYLEKALTDMCLEIEALGVDCQDCIDASIDDLAAAIGRQLHGPSFRLRVPPRRDEREEAAR